jgi:hypothetical protein
MDNITLDFAGFSVEFAALPTATQEHLARLGWSTAIKNAKAGIVAGVLGTAKDPWSDEEIAAAFAEATQTEWNGERSDEVANIIADHAQRQKFEALLSGDISSRGVRGPRMTPDEKLRREIAIEKLEAVAKAQGKKLPKRSGKDEAEKARFEKMLSDALSREKFAAAVEKEFQARRKAKVVEGLDDLFEEV